MKAPPFNDVVCVRIGAECYTGISSTFALEKLVKPHFNDVVGVRKGVESVLDVALADYTEVPHYFDGCVAEHVVVAVVQRLRYIYATYCRYIYAIYIYDMLRSMFCSRGCPASARRRY